jgi:integrase
MPRFRARTRAKKGDELSHPLQGELAAYEKVGLFARAVTPRSAYRYRGVPLQYQKALGGDPPTLEASCRFLARLREDGFKPSTLRLYRAVLQGFHAWRGERLVFPVRVPRCLPPYHSAELVNRMLALAETKPRDHVILLLMSDAGLRRGEVISLRVRDVDLTGKMLRLRGKGGHDRVVPLTGELHALLKSLCRGKALDESVVGVKDKAVYQTVNLMNRLLLLEVSPVAG